MTLRLENLTYRVEEQLLLGPLNATFGTAMRTVVLGPNGAGKSLLLRLCHGLILPSSGHVAAPQNQAMIFQRPVLLRRSAAANVDYALRLKGHGRAARQAIIADMLASTGLADKARQQAPSLSVGEQQRLALARAWAGRPDFLLMDEPTASLDPAATHAVETLIANMVASGTRIVMTTHDLGQALRLAEEILFLHNGKLLEQRPAADFFAHPATAEAEAFIAGRLSW